MSKKLTPEEANFMKTVGERLREIRRNKGYGSYDFFAWENNISPTTYRNMERGKNVTLLSLRKVLKALNITLDEFFKGMKY